LVEIELLSKFERGRHDVVRPWDWMRELDVSEDFFRSMVFALFAERCLDGTPSAPPGVAAEDAHDDVALSAWGQPSTRQSARALLAGQAFSAHINHAGRLRLWRLRDEILAARTKEPFGLLWDRRHWTTDVSLQLALSGADSPSVVLFIDVDDFRAVNDNAGRTAGDQVLRVIFRSALDAVAGAGDAYRWGGDEVAILLPGVGRDDGHRIGEAIRAAVQRQCAALPRLSDAGLQATVSAAVGPFRGRPTPEAITTAAAELMKRAKRLGRNKVLAEDLPL
jgi:diguanylate cyclase (GGDEF)-like protein